MNPIFRTIDFTLATILRSSLHALLSRNLTLITVTGHTSQRSYTVPVSYQQRDREVRIVSERADRWGRNVRDDAPVTLQLQGHQVARPVRVIEALPASLASLSDPPRRTAERLAVVCVELTSSTRRGHLT
jgi:hypothetical protein